MPFRNRREYVRMSPPIQRVCVFCGGSPVTREHVYPQWLETVLPDQERFRGQITMTEVAAGLEDHTRDRVQREMGQRFTDTTVRRVCEPCNGGWMNDLEMEVRPVLEKLIAGKTLQVAEDRAIILARWVAKTAMMAQLTDPETLVTGSDDFHWLYSHGTPPRRMRIWLFPLDAPDWCLRFQHRAVLLGSKDTKITDPCNVHATAFGLGALGVFVSGWIEPKPLLDAVHSMVPDNGQRHWPYPASFVWDRRHPFDDAGMWLLADLLPLWYLDSVEEFLQREPDARTWVSRRI